jgi:molybdate transport system substrate-binding protein
VTATARRAATVVSAPLAMALVLAACTGGGAAAPPTASSPASEGAGTANPDKVDAGELTVFGAASLTEALTAVKAAYQAAHPGTSLVISTDSSAALATQIEQGAPADVFLSADTENARRLVDGGFARGQPVSFAANELAIVVPAGNPAGLASPADLARPGLKVIAAGVEVPITGYATQLVANLAALPGYPADFEAAYAANVVSREDNVKAVLAKIALGEGDAGIVYRTDAESSPRVDTIAIPAGANVRASYAGVVVGSSPRPGAAQAFLDWLTGPAGQAILASFGFVAPS